MVQEEDFSICNLFSHSMFSQIDLEIDGQNLTVSDHLYAYKAYLETLLSYGTDAKNSHLATSLYCSDSPYLFDTMNENNIGYLKRREFVKNSKIFDFCISPHIDFFQTSRYLPPGVSFKLKFTRNKDSFSILSDSGKEFMVKIHNLSLFVHRVQASEKMQKRFEQTLTYKNALYPITKSYCKKIMVPAGLTNANQPNVIHGKLPRQLVVGFTSAEAMNGNFQLNPFNFKHFECNFLALRINGSQIPSKGFRPIFQDKLVRRELRTLYDNVGVLTENHGCLIDVDGFCGGSTLFCFDLCDDKSDGIHSHQDKTGTIDLEISFSSPLPEAISVLCYAAFDTVIALTKDRNILLY